VQSFHAAKNAGIWGRQHGCLQQERGYNIFLEYDKKGQTSHRDN